MLKTTRSKHVIDATGQTLGRLSTQIATLLRGKHKVGFVLNQDLGDFVTVNNVDKVVLTGKKEQQKMYYHHSGFPGGLRETTYKVMHETHPERIITLAVERMLPDNRLRRGWMSRLDLHTSKETNAS